MDDWSTCSQSPREPVSPGCGTCGKSFGFRNRITLEEVNWDSSKNTDSRKLSWSRKKGFLKNLGSTEKTPVRETPSREEPGKVAFPFYRDFTLTCQRLDRYLAILAEKHLETKFSKLNVERVPLLCGRRWIKVTPTLALLRERKCRIMLLDTPT